MNRSFSCGALIAATLLAACASPGSKPPGKPEYMVVGIDNKVTWGEDGALLKLPGKPASMRGRTQ